MKYRTLVQVLMLGVALVISGCGMGSSGDRWKDARPATSPASGVITFQGEPLEGAVVVFQPSAPGGVGASAMTDTDGRFELKTFPPELGAVPGIYSVVVMKTHSRLPTEIAVSPDESEPIEMISLIPEKYGVADTSGLVAEIPIGGTASLEFKLED